MFKLTDFIAYLETTDESEWAVGVVREPGNIKNCMFGHLVNFYYGKDYEGNINGIWDMFEECYATTYMIYPVNDGENPRYIQPTAKARVIAYLKNLDNRLEPSTQELWNRHAESIKN